jgi:uncharacterized protein YggE
MMKQINTILNTLLVCILLLIVVAVGLPNLNAQAASPAVTTEDPSVVCNTGRSIQVSGTAVVNVTPDRVLIQLGVQSNATTPQRVEALNSSTINHVIQDLKALGIAEKDIVTDWYVIDPIYEDYDDLYIKGYRINNMVAITLRDISKVNKVVIAALKAGANRVVNVEFYLSDLRKYRDQARELAMIAAHEKAQDLATAAGAETGCVMNINENSWSYYNGGWYGQNRDLWTQNTVQNASPSMDGGALSDSGPVNLGQISVRAEVSASFSLK